jgi:hypothetical protein
MAYLPISVNGIARGQTARRSLAHLSSIHGRCHMNRFVLALGLFLLMAPAWAQTGPPDRGVCVARSLIVECTGLDEQTLAVDAGKKDYLFTVEPCSTLTGRHCTGTAGNPGIYFDTVGQNRDNRVCEGNQIIFRDANNQLQRCVIQDIVRYQIDPLTSEVKLDEIDD